jgi:hypothetical protein
MKLKKTNHKFIQNPYITTAVDQHTLMSTSMKYFDKDGYELNHVEQLYHREQGINIDEDFLYHKANHVPWLVDVSNNNSGVVLDHCMMMQRWAYAGEAKEQLMCMSRTNPELNKLLSIKPKWGFDISIDYVFPGGAVELFHIEYDYYNYNQAVDDMHYYEEIILSIDWENSVQDILRRKHEWQHLCSDDQADWKVQYFGFHRAFDNRKVFS